MQFLVKTTLITCLLVLGGIIHPFSALGYRLDDFRVNDSIPPANIFSIQLSTNGKGRFAVTWLNSSDAGAYLRIYRINGTSISPPVKLPDIIDNGQLLRTGRIENALLPNGNVVVTRSVIKDSTDIYGQPYPFGRGYVQIFDSLGNLLLPPFRADTLPSSTHRHITYAGVAADSQGNFTVVITIQVNINEKYSWPVYFQQFYPDGQKRGDLTLVSDCTEDVCTKTTQFHTISMRPDGKFIVSWDIGFYPGIKIFSQEGTPLTNVLTPSCDDSLPWSCMRHQPTCKMGLSTRIGMNGSGNFIMALNGCNDAPYEYYQSYIRMYDSLANPLTTFIDIDDLELTYSNNSAPKGLAMNDSEYVVVWLDRGNDPSKPNGDVYLKRYRQDGTQIGIKYRANNQLATASSHEHTRIAISNGHIFIVWRAGGSRIYAQIMPLDEIGFFNPGDLNYDYNIDLADLIGAVNYVFKGAGPPEGSPLVCDINGDCKVNIVDIIYMVNYIFKNGKAPIGCPIIK